MNTKQINTLILGIMGTILSFLYPPFIHLFSEEEKFIRRDYRTEYKMDYNFLFALDETDVINVPILLNQFIIIAVIVLGFLLIFRNKRTQ